MSRRLVGQDPRRIRGHIARLLRDGYWGSGPVVSSAVGAIEIALWDILGKSLDAPLYQLLGGAYRDSIDVYSNAWYFGARSADEFATRAQRATGMGFRALKFDPFGFAGFAITPRQLGEAIERIDAVREAVGPDVELLIEGHGRFGVQSAIRIGLELERFKVAFFEEPVKPGDLDATRRVVDAVRVPIAAGERCYDLGQCEALVRQGRVSVLQADVIHVGGVMTLLAASALADAAHVSIAPHNAAGPIGAAATLHVAAVVPNLFLQEMFAPDDAPWKDAIAQPALRIVDGRIEPPSGPGLGIDLVMEEAERHPYVPRDLDFYDDRSILHHPVAPGAGGSATKAAD
jgi:galactonate dehydratase